MKTSRSLEVLFAPAEFSVLPARDLSQTACVVFDILRATSTIITALVNGAAAVIPKSEIADCVQLRHQRSDVLLAGERQGLRIDASNAEGIEFDFGNSPREFTRQKVEGRTIALTTSNGSRALRSCAAAQSVFAASFLNLRATADYLGSQRAPHILLICAGTFEQTALEDALAAGAMVELLKSRFAEGEIADSARIAADLYRANSSTLAEAIADSRNGRRLLSIPELRDDVAWCLQRDIFPLVARLNGDAIATD